MAHGNVLKKEGSLRPASRRRTNLAILAADAANEIEGVMNGKQDHGFDAVHTLSSRLKDSFPSGQSAGQSLHSGLVSFRSIMVARRALGSVGDQPMERQWTTENVIERVQEFAQRLGDLTSCSDATSLAAARDFCRALSRAIVRSWDATDHPTPEPDSVGRSR